jgi:hypothetical protein
MATASRAAGSGHWIGQPRCTATTPVLTCTGRASGIQPQFVVGLGAVQAGITGGSLQPAAIPSSTPFLRIPAGRTGHRIRRRGRISTTGIRSRGVRAAERTAGPGNSDPLPLRRVDSRFPVLQRQGRGGLGIRFVYPVGGADHTDRDGLVRIGELASSPWFSSGDPTRGLPGSERGLRTTNTPERVRAHAWLWPARPPDALPPTR